jgi:hypothetical protein
LKRLGNHAPSYLIVQALKSSFDTVGSFLTNVVLLGDSIFDNGAYVGAGDPDVIGQLRAILPGGWRATLNAVDGAGMSDIRGQIARLFV